MDPSWSSNASLRTSPSRYRFFHTTGGVLHLNLVQDVFISTALSPCNQTVGLQNERGHVRDNENLMPRMDAALRADEQFNLIMVQGMEFPVSQLDEVKRGSVGHGVAEAQRR